MGPSTVQFWQQQLDTRLTAQAQAQSGLQAVQAMQKEKAAALSTALAALDAGAAKIAARRASLAVTTIPAEAEALLKLITQDLIAQRALHGTVLELRAQLDDADARAAVASAVLARCAAQVGAARAAAAQADTGRKARDKLRAAVALPPLLTIAADAATLKASPTAAKALTRFTLNFPKPMQDLARARVASRRRYLDKLREVLAAAQDAQAAAQAADKGREGAVQEASLALQRKEAALAGQVASAGLRYARARTLLLKLEAIDLAPDTLPDILTEAEKAARKALDEAGEEAAGTAAGLETKLQKVFDTEAALNLALIAQLADPPPEHGGEDVTEAREAFLAARKAFTDALAAFAATAAKTDLDAWEAVIPDPAWRVLLDHIVGTDDLEQLAGLDLSKMADEMAAAEDTYVAALDAAGKAQRRADAHADEVALREALLAAAQASFENRLASAVRGDSY